MPSNDLDCLVIMLLGGYVDDLNWFQLKMSKVESNPRS